MRPISIPLSVSSLERMSVPVTVIILNTEDHRLQYVRFSYTVTNVITSMSAFGFQKLHLL
jgi:hypothetical protein